MADHYWLVCNFQSILTDATKTQIIRKSQTIIAISTIPPLYKPAVKKFANNFRLYPFELVKKQSFTVYQS